MKVNKNLKETDWPIEDENRPESIAKLKTCEFLMEKRYRGFVQRIDVFKKTRSVRKNRQLGA